MNNIILVSDGYNLNVLQIYIPVRQTVKISMRPGSRFPSIGIERASIAQDTVANVVATVIVCSVLKDRNKIRMQVWNFLYFNKLIAMQSIYHSMMFQHSYLTNKNIP